MKVEEDRPVEAKNFETASGATIEVKVPVKKWLSN
jgi:hypothetical protein